MRIILFYLLTFFAINSFSQVTADFSLSDTEGCEPMHITFTNSSLGTGLSYSWDFGNGNTSTLESPDANFGDAGQYDITLTATDGSSTDIITKTLIVHPNPVANFSPQNYNGCVGETVQFTDLSTTAGSDIVDWIWDFRDGSFPPHISNPSNTYSIANIYGVSLEVIDANGCSAFIERLDIINISVPPISYYSASETFSCAVPLTVDFESTVNNPITPPYSYNWDLGDGTTSGQTNPSTTYSDFGYYDVSLTVTDGNGCMYTSYSPNINIANMQSSFYVIVEGDTLQEGDTICPGQTVDYVDNSTGNGSIVWQNGGVNMGSGVQAIQYLTESGVQNITHTISYGACTSSSSFSFFVDLIEANFGPDFDSVCAPYSTFQFTDASVNAVSWIYVWGDGDSSFVQNPSHSFSISYPVNDYEGHWHYYTQFAYNARGCVDSEVRSIYFDMPFAEFVSDIEEGASPLSIEFTNFSKPQAYITDYVWLHNGVPFSTEENPDFTFIDPGVHEIQLVVSNDEGCMDTSIIREIIIGAPIFDEDSLSNLDSAAACDCSSGICYPGGTIAFCASEEFSITIFEIDTNYIYEFNGEGLSHNCSDNNSGIFNITGVTGLTTISASINNYGYITQLPPISIMLNGPYVSFSYVYDCDSALKYSFISEMLDVTSFEWDFGDGVTDTTNINPFHTYNTSGDYDVQLSAYNDQTGCSYVFSQIVVVRDLKAFFELEDSLCVGSYEVELSQTEFEYSPISKPYFWSINDIPVGYKDSTYIIPISEGYQKIQLVVRDTNFCTDTLVREVVGLQPHANFFSDVLAGCPPLEVELTDTSSSAYGFLDRYWIIENDTIHGDSIPSYTFDNVGSYSIRLVVTDSLSCTNGLTKFSYINIANPNANIFANDYTICEGEQVTFSTDYYTADQMIWYIDTAVFITNSGTSLSYIFDEWGSYDASIVIWESNCSDSTVISNQIHVQEAVAGFSVSDTISNCYPADISFDFIGEHPEDVASWVWDFDDNNAGSINPDTVRYNFGHPGQYTISLNTTTSYGCPASAILNIEINGPLGDLLIDRTHICYGEEVVFQVVDTQSVGTFYLDYGDGSGSNQITSSHIYNNAFFGEIHPTLILYSDANDLNLCKVDVDKVLNVHKVLANFSVSDMFTNEDTLIGCAPFVVNLTNQSLYSDEYSWDFGNGNTANFTEGSEVFSNNSHTSPISYTIALTATNTTYNCTGDTSIEITVLPVPEINLIEDSVICYGDTIQIVASGTTEASLMWIPNALNESNPLWAPFVSPDEESQYIAILNLDGCLANDTVTIYVQDELDVTWSMDTTIIIGETANVFAIPDQTSSVPTWTPSYAISCVQCSSAIVQPLTSTTYTFSVQDSVGCSTITGDIYIEVREEYSVNLPSSFTPNSDGVNDVVYVKGWGIEELLEFRVYNRWGEEIFISNDLYLGWDGTYRGTLQNIDTYAYVVKAKMFNGQIVSKKGSITLMR